MIPASVPGVGRTADAAARRAAPTACRAGSPTSGTPVGTRSSVPRGVPGCGDLAARPVCRDTAPACRAGLPHPGTRTRTDAPSQRVGRQLHRVPGCGDLAGRSVCREAAAACCAELPHPGTQTPTDAPSQRVGRQLHRVPGCGDYAGRSVCRGTGAACCAGLPHPVREPRLMPPLRYANPDGCAESASVVSFSVSRDAEILRDGRRVGRRERRVARGCRIPVQDPRRMHRVSVSVVSFSVSRDAEILRDGRCVGRRKRRVARGCRIPVQDPRRMPHPGTRTTADAHCGTPIRGESTVRRRSGASRRCDADHGRAGSATPFAAIASRASIVAPATAAGMMTTAPSGTRNSR